VASSRTRLHTRDRHVAGRSRDTQSSSIKALLRGWWPIGVSARAVLDEWIRLGAVKLNAKGEVTWAKPEFSKGSELDLITRSMLMTGDRITAAIDTLDNHGENHFVWSVRGAYLTTADVMKLKALAKKLALQISHSLNVEVTKLEERGRATGNGDQRFAFCSHSIHEPMAVLEKTGYKLW
jgi:hypothetical protein